MTYVPERDRIPLEELLKPVSAKVTPKRLRYATGVNDPLTDTEVTRVSRQSATVFWKRKHGGSK